MGLRRALADHTGTAVAAAVVVAVAAGVAFMVLASDEGLPEGLIQANGRIEGDRLTAASQVAGRVVAVPVREGDRVEEGVAMVRLDDARVRARVRQAEARLHATEAQADAARRSLRVLEREVPLGVDAATAALARATAAHQRAVAAAEQAVRDAERFSALAARGSVPDRRAEEARTAAATSREEVEAARSGVEQARSELGRARLGERRIRAREAEVRAARSHAARARAVLDEARAGLDDLVIRAPAAGTVVESLVDPGEAVVPGSPVLEVVDLDRLYLKAYVPEPTIGKLRRGLEARIWTDAYPDAPYDATLRFIASEAEFTPKEVQTAEQRVKMVYEIRLYLEENPDHELTPGMPADAVIRWRDGVAWEPPRW